MTVIRDDSRSEALCRNSSASRLEELILPPRMIGNEPHVRWPSATLRTLNRIHKLSRSEPSILSEVASSSFMLLRGRECLRRKREMWVPFHRKLTGETRFWLAGERAMILASTISFLFGIALAQRFNVTALVPAMAIVMVLSSVAGIAHPQSAWEIVKTAGIAALCLQCGYFAGIIIRYSFSDARPEGSTPVTNAEPSTHRTAL